MAIAIGMWETDQWNAPAGSWKRDGRIANLATAKLASDTDLARCGTILAHSRDLARKVAALMLRDLGWTQQKIADELGVSQQAVAGLTNKGESAVVSESLIARAIEIVPDADLAGVADRLGVSARSSSEDW